MQFGDSKRQEMMLGSFKRRGFARNLWERRSTWICRAGFSKRRGLCKRFAGEEINRERFYREILRVHGLRKRYGAGFVRSWMPFSAQCYPMKLQEYAGEEINRDLGRFSKEGFCGVQDLLGAGFVRSGMRFLFLSNTHHFS